MQPVEVKKLIRQYLDGTIAEPQFRELWEALARPELKQEWQKAIEAYFHDEQLHGLSENQQALQSLESVKRRIQLTDDGVGELHAVPLRKMRFRTHLRIAAAILIIAGVSVF